MAEYENGRYDVVRYPNHFEVIDKQNGNSTVRQFSYSVGSRERAHALCAKLNREHKAITAALDLTKDV